MAWDFIRPDEDWYDPYNDDEYAEPWQAQNREIDRYLYSLNRYEPGTETGDGS